MGYRRQWFCPFLCFFSWKQCLACRFRPEAEHSANAGLHIARELLEPVKKNHPWISYSDLWTLAGCVAVEELGGESHTLASLLTHQISTIVSFPVSKTVRVSLPGHGAKSKMTHCCKSSCGNCASYVFYANSDCWSMHTLISTASWAQLIPPISPCLSSMCLRSDPLVSCEARGLDQAQVAPLSLPPSHSVYGCSDHAVICRPPGQVHEYTLEQPPLRLPFALFVYIMCCVKGFQTHRDLGSSHNMSPTIITFCV